MAFRVNTWLSAIFCVGTALGALPQGPEPDPVACPHFPSRMHALVWRNWDLVPTARIASVLGTDAPTVEALAADLGLEPAAGPFFGQRMALTIIRRNWHLLDYPQLLALLDWNAAQLADCLIEDDFLWIKLGRLKPRCEPLRYRPPTDEERAHAAGFRAIVRAEKERVGSEPGEPRFAFLEKLSAPFAAAPRPVREESFSIRFIYSYFAVFGDPLLDTSLDPYPDGYLARLAALGVNGVWLHVVLRHLAPGVLFPEEAARAAARLKNLRTLAQRTRRHGIGLYLYFNEPRAQPEAFFASHAELKGVTAHGFSTLCTSTPTVRAFLREGAARVFAAAPELAGFFTITGSENLTSCWSHQGGAACPRCNPRGPQEVVAEVSRLLAEGAWSSQPAAEAIVWDWGWPSHWVDGIVTRLPARCRLMSVSEWSVPITRGGVASAVGEYSLSAIGPGPRASAHWEKAAARGMRTMAKVQVNSTWELSSLPWIPVPFNVAEHMHRLREHDLSGLMLSWSLGGYPSVNLRVVDAFLGKELPDVDQALTQAAAQTYGERAAPAAVAAWRRFSEAFDEFPFHIGVLYSGPQQLGPANPLYPEKTGYRATMTGIPYDDLDAWRAVYPPDVFETQSGALAAKWEDGVRAFEKTVALAPEGMRAEARCDLDVARAAGLHFRSVHNQVRFIRTRDALAEARDDDARAALRARLGDVCDAEIACARDLYRIARRDARIGFEAANQYFYLPRDLLEKIVNCAHVKKEYR